MANGQPAEQYNQPTIAPFVEIDYPMIDRHNGFSIEVDDDIVNVSNEEPCIYNIIGCIVKLHEEYVLLYTPFNLEKIWKVLVKKEYVLESPFSKEVKKIELGQWMRVDVVQRLVQAYDKEYRPRYSHIAISKAEYFDIKGLVPNWEQRFVAGVYQIQVTVTLENEETCCEDVKDKRGIIYHVIKSDQAIEIIVPGHRLAPIYTNPSYKNNILRFWVNRGRFIFGSCLHLFEQSQIDEYYPDGSAVIHVSPLIYQEEYYKAISNTKNDLSSYSQDSHQDSLSEEMKQLDINRNIESEENTSAGFTSNAVTGDQPFTEEFINALKILMHPIILGTIWNEGLENEYACVKTVLKKYACERIEDV